MRKREQEHVLYSVHIHTHIYCAISTSSLSKGLLLLISLSLSLLCLLSPDSTANNHPYACRKKHEHGEDSGPNTHACIHTDLNTTLTLTLHRLFTLWPSSLILLVSPFHSMSPLLECILYTPQQKSSTGKSHLSSWCFNHCAAASNTMAPTNHTGE